MLFFGVFLRESARTAAKSRTNLSTNSGKGWADWHQIWETCAYSSGNRYIRQTNCPSRHKGAHGLWWGGGGGLGGQQFKILGSCQTAGPIGIKFGTRLRIRLGMDIG